MSSLKKALSIAIVLAFFAAMTLCKVQIARAEEKVKKSELNNTMEEMDDAMKKLKRTIRKAESNKESLKLISEIQKQSLLCKEMTPTKTEKLPEADREKFVKAYRKEMAGVIIDLCTMEQAILDGDNAKAQETYKALVEREDKGHDQFMPKKEDKKKE